MLRKQNAYFLAATSSATVRRGVFVDVAAASDLLMVDNCSQNVESRQ